MVIGPHAESQSDLLQITDTSDALRFGFGFGQSGQEQTCKNRDDGNHHEKLD